MSDHRKTKERAVVKGHKAGHFSNLQGSSAGHNMGSEANRSPGDDNVVTLLPEEVGLRLLSDKHDPEFSSLALEASPAWERLDPARIRSMVADQEWPRQLYMTQLCDIVYCRLTDECFVQWLPAGSPPRRIRITPRRVGDREPDDWDASHGPFTPPVRRLWHQTYPATEIPVPTKDYRWGRRRAGMPSCIGSRAPSCDWVFSKTPDLENQGPKLLVTVPEGEEFFLIPPDGGKVSDS